MLCGGEDSQSRPILTWGCGIVLLRGSEKPLTCGICIACLCQQLVQLGLKLLDVCFNLQADCPLLPSCSTVPSVVGLGLSCWLLASGQSRSVTDPRACKPEQEWSRGTIPGQPKGGWDWELERQCRQAKELLLLVTTTKE